MSWNFYSNDGQRKYLTKSDINLFLDLAKSHDNSIYSFCWIMAVTGCRISEALSLGEHSIDFEAKQVIILCLEKRSKRVFRAIPLPQDLLKSLERWMNNGTLPREKFWPWSRMTAYRRICEIMRQAGLSGSYASPKGLRHGFAVRAIQSNVPLTLVQRWLGHADIKTTAIYTSATGPEEREMAARLWSTPAESRRARTKVTPRRIKLLAGKARDAEKAEEIEFPAQDARQMALSVPFDAQVLERLIIQAAGNEVCSGRLPGEDRDNPRQIGAIPSCCLLHYWLFCNSTFTANSVAYTAIPASLAAQRL